MDAARINEAAPCRAGERRDDADPVGSRIPRQSDWRHHTSLYLPGH
jgi:hypothetical protein